MVPCDRPRRSHSTRCSDEPWVHDSGETRPWRAALQRVVADGGGSAHAFLDVAFLQQLLARVIAPHAGEAIGLQLLQHRQPVALGLPGALTPGLHLLGHAEQRLQMVADLVGDDVGLGEVAGGAELLVEFAEEPEVDVELLIGRAVEGADRRRVGAARRLHGVVEQHQGGRLVARARLLEEARPHVLGGSEHDGGKLRLRVASGRANLALLRRGLLAGAARHLQQS